MKSRFKLFATYCRIQTQYPKDIFYLNLGYFVSLNTLEEWIENFILNAEPAKDRFLELKMISAEEYDIADKKELESLSRRIYDNIGILAFNQPVPDDSEFFGYKTYESLKKIGEKIEFLYCKKIYVGIIAGLPTSTDDAQRLKKRSSGVRLDMSDNCYLVNFGENKHDHPRVYEVFNLLENKKY